MLTFLSVAFLVYGSMHLYVFSKVWLALPHTLGVAMTLVLLGLVMTLSPLILWQVAKQNWHVTTIVLSWATYLWMGFVLLFCTIALVFDFCYVVVTILGSRWPLSEAGALATLCSLALVVMAYGFVEAGQLGIKRITIVTPKLPQSAGPVTIAQISDLHLGVMHGPEFVDGIVGRLRELHPDIVVATGDILDGQGDDLDDMARHLLAYKPPKGAYAIIGNHEYYAGLGNALRFLNDAGYTVLRGESAKSEGIVFVGVDDPSVGALAKEMSMDTRRALDSARNDAFIVLLKHQPMVDGDIPFDLQLSGHTHGGQIFPFGYMTWLTYRVWPGLTRFADGRQLYLSRGAGTWGPPIRVLAPPDITLITVEGTGR